MSFKQTTDQFIQKAMLKHRDRYDYSLVDYKGNTVKVKIICKIHGIFEQQPNNHLDGKGCIRCGKRHKPTTSEFIEQAKAIHGNLYDYSLVNYKNAKTKVKIICKDHGIFNQIPDKHINSKQGCPKCTGRYITTEEFIEKAKKVHSFKYDYSLTQYKTGRGKIKIICSKHGIFEQRAAHHLKGHGCKKCGIEPYSISKSLASANKFVIKANKIHNNLYDYSLVKYKNSSIFIDIICKEHGIFEQSPNNHLNKQGCPKCVGKFKTTEDIINDFTKIHGDKYDYSKVNYVSAKDKVLIICKKHGEFLQRVNHHIKRKQGCPICKESKGENKIREFLLKNNINFIFQHRFKDCIDTRPLPFDFYLPELNICIEYDGEQHFNPIEAFGGTNKLLERQKKDKIKDNYCKNNKITLLRIKYDEDIIEKLSKNIIFDNIYN